MKKVKIKTNNVIHLLTFYKECEWENGDCKQVRHEARKHSIKFGHTISLEEGISKTVIFY